MEKLKNVIDAAWDTRENIDTDTKGEIREAIETGGTQNLTSIQIAIESSGGLQYTADCARKEVQLAIKNLDVLPKSKYKDGLRSLAMFAINRRF